MKIIYQLRNKGDEKYIILVNMLMRVFNSDIQLLKSENNYVILIRYDDQNFSMYLMKETEYGIEKYSVQHQHYNFIC